MEWSIVLPPPGSGSHLGAGEAGSECAQEKGQSSHSSGVLLVALTPEADVSVKILVCDALKMTAIYIYFDEIKLNLKYLINVTPYT